jgi:hypothetical protein
MTAAIRGSRIWQTCTIVRVVAVLLAAPILRIRRKNPKVPVVRRPITSCESQVRSPPRTRIRNRVALG